MNSSSDLKKKTFLIALVVIVIVLSVILARGTGTVASAKPNDKGGQVSGCNENSDCGEDEFCELKEGDCEGEVAKGICKRKPEICTMDFDPVCGCDGNNYSNTCAAHAKGVTVQSEGSCNIP